MGNGLETLANSSPDMDNNLMKISDDVKWINSDEFYDSRKVLNLLKQTIIDNKIPLESSSEFEMYSKYLINSLEKDVKKFNKNKSKNMIEENLEEKLINGNLSLTTNSFNSDLYVENSNRPYKRKVNIANTTE